MRNFTGLHIINRETSIIVHPETDEDYIKKIILKRIKNFCDTLSKYPIIPISFKFDASHVSKTENGLAVIPFKIWFDYDLLRKSDEETFEKLNKEFSKPQSQDLHAPSKSKIFYKRIPSNKLEKTINCLKTENGEKSFDSKSFWKLIIEVLEEYEPSNFSCKKISGSLAEYEIEISEIHHPTSSLEEH